MEFGEMVADILDGVIAKQLQLRRVGTKNGALAPDQMEGDRAVLEKILQVDRVDPGGSPSGQVVH
jgi:hypothetical protein